MSKAAWKCRQGKQGSWLHPKYCQCCGHPPWIPSGKRLHNYGKSPFFMGKLTISMVIFNSYVKLPEGRDALHIPKYVWIRFRFWPPRAQPQPMHPSAASQLHPSGGWRKQEEKILESLLQLPKGNELPWITETAGTCWDPCRHHKGLHLVHLRRRNGLRNLQNSDAKTPNLHLNLMSGWPAMDKPTNQSHKDNLPVSCFINLPVRHCFV